MILPMSAMSVMYANAEIETMPRERLEELQLERLQKAVKWAAEKSAFYQQKFDAAGVQPDDIKTLADIRKLPFVTSLELHQASAMDRLTMPMSSVLRVSYQKEMGREMLSLYSNGDIATYLEYYGINGYASNDTPMREYNVLRYKLMTTYLSYLPKEKAIYDLKMNTDARGSFTERYLPSCLGRGASATSHGGLQRNASAASGVRCCALLSLSGAKNLF